MKRNLVLIIIFNLFFISSAIAATSEYLKIELPSESLMEKRRLHIDTNQIKSIIKEYLKESVTANIEFIDKNAKILAKFGRIKKGKIKWDFKLVDETYLLVKFDTQNYWPLVEKIKEKSIEPAYELALSDLKTKTIIKSYDIVFAEFPELTVSIKHPEKLAPGVEINNSITVRVENKGRVEARDFSLDLVLSSDFKIAYQPAVASDTFKDDMLLQNGRIKIESLKPGEIKTLSFKDPILLPADLAPKQYYLGAVIDSDNQIMESDKNNNIFSGFLMITVPAPKKVTVALTDARLDFQPKGYAFKIVSRGINISDGKEWRRCRMKPNIYQFQHGSWKDFHWEINTVRRTLWRITGAKFCKTGGKAKQIKTKMKVIGGSASAAPESVSLELPETRLEFLPETRKFQINTFDSQISYTQLWQTCAPASHLYQFKHNYWQDFYLEINTLRNTFSQVTGKTLCKTGGNQKNLNLEVKIEK